MSKMIQTLTLSYPDRKNYFGPKVQVLFTNLSKFKYKDEEEEDSESFEPESDEDLPKKENKEEEKEE
jgi:hypothetical protein